MKREGGRDGETLGYCLLPMLAIFDRITERHESKGAGASVFMASYNHMDYKMYALEHVDVYCFKFHVNIKRIKLIISRYTYFESW